MALTTITPKFQVHIPVEIRKKAGLTKHGRAKIDAKDGKIIIESFSEKEDIMSLAGTIKPRKDINPDKIRDYIDYSDL